MKYFCARVVVLTLLLGVAFSSEDEKSVEKKSVDKRGALGLGNALGHGFGASGSSSGFGAPSLSPASYSGFTPALGAPAGWASIRTPFAADPSGYAQGSGAGPHGPPGYNYASAGAHGGPWNQFPDGAFGLGPAVLNKRTSLAAGLAHPDIGAATAAAHDRYAASASNSAYGAGNGPWAVAAPWAGAGPWSSAGWSSAGLGYPNGISKYGGACRC